MEKLIKDYADVIALLDPMSGGTELDFNFLGEKLGDFDFLKGCLRKIPETHDAIVKYNRMNQRKVREIIERLLVSSSKRMGDTEGQQMHFH